MKLLILDSNSVKAGLVAQALERAGNQAFTVPSATAAIQLVDASFDAVVVELALRHHSGTEFLYEFRTHEDLSAIPVIVFTTVALKPGVLTCRDWQLFAPCDYLYAPETSLERLVEVVASKIVTHP